MKCDCTCDCGSVYVLVFTRQAAQLQVPQAAGVVERCGRMVAVVVGHDQQGKLALVQRLTSDQTQVDQRDGRSFVHGDQDVATDLLDGLTEDRGFRNGWRTEA